ncbi:MAG: DmsE family decaheme c-type cytochrome [Nitrospinales bacterium]
MCWKTNYIHIVISLILILIFPISGFAEKKINWEKINPILKGASSVTSSQNVDDQSECLLCHEKYIKVFERTRHARYLAKEFNKNIGGACEICHGPMSKHLTEIRKKSGESARSSKKNKAKFVVSFSSISAPKKNAICLQCHEKYSLMNWKGSMHQMSGVSCDQCHYVMKKKDKAITLINENPNQSCFQCHMEKRAAMYRTSHMPQREGKIKCSSCHNPHGGFGPSLLKRSSVNETCFLCHQEKRGPFIWDHPPVRENCSTCHEPHGSNISPLLKQKTPFLCQQCHLNGSHPGNLYSGQALKNRSPFLAGKACLNCHSLIHGSNHPSGARFQR